ncbi:PH domain-containing protein [Paenarthrobacter sp. RAF54_2]|uniref:PH domain-containing protein n=1 Tax=Paenarthrobacter sp. RAF54_2 TaxID=3233061 RepID=UPI003F97EC20
MINPVTRGDRIPWAQVRFLRFEPRRRGLWMTRVRVKTPDGGRSPSGVYPATGPTAEAHAMGRFPYGR